eukprot:9477979-Pyramimonas_sp.AAC.1
MVFSDHAYGACVYLPSERTRSVVLEPYPDFPCIERAVPPPRRIDAELQSAMQHPLPDMDDDDAELGD